MEDWRVLIRFRLRAEGLAVIAEATDASEGVRLAGDRQPDAIVLDVHMPELSGIGALARIRAAAPDATVVVVSGFGEGAWREQAIELGAAAYFDKAALNDLVSFLRGENGARR